MKTTKTRVFALMLALVLTLSLAACGGNSNAPSSDENTHQSSPSQAGTTTPDGSKETPALVQTPQTNVSTAQETGLFASLVPQVGDGEKFMFFHSVNIGFFDNWTGEMNLKETDITDFIVYVNGTPNNVALSDMHEDEEDFSGQGLKKSYTFNLGTKFDQYPAVYTISFKLNGQEYSHNQLRFFQINEDKTIEFIAAGSPIPTLPSSSTSNASSTPAASTSTAPSIPKFDLSKVAESAYSLKSDLSGDTLTITIHDDNLAEAYKADDFMAYRLQVHRQGRNVFMFDGQVYEEDLRLDSISFGWNTDDFSEGTAEFDYDQKNIIVTLKIKGSSITELSSLTMDVIISYGSERKSVSISG